MHRQSDRAESGFTLLEVLIALGILAVSLVAMYVSQGNSLIANGAADKLTVATLLANQQMTEWRLELEEDLRKGDKLDEKEETGDFEVPYEEFHWSRRVRKVEIPIVLPGGEEDGSQNALMSQAKGVLEEVSKAVREVTVRVAWGEGDDEESYILTTHLVNMAAVKVFGGSTSSESKSDGNADTETNTEDENTETNSNASGDEGNTTP